MSLPGFTPPYIPPVSIDGSQSVQGDIFPTDLNSLLSWGQNFNKTLENLKHIFTPSGNGNANPVQNGVQVGAQTVEQLSSSAVQSATNDYVQPVIDEAKTTGTKILRNVGLVVLLFIGIAALLMPTENGQSSIIIPPIE